jgi:hypothetical protein
MVAFLFIMKKMKPGMNTISHKEKLHVNGGKKILVEIGFKIN